MSRARAASLALVNWKGVFFERYLLDRHVTALEGANGAGKTTVMIAAYVVLLPDMSRLRFTNLGESAATGGDRGVFGRLGDGGGPAYSAIDFELPDGTRLIAGVKLERKAEPSVELTPFVISDLDASRRISDLLLISHEEHDEVPNLEQVAASVTRAGARLTVFPSAKEYFAALFERGVTPLRLSTDEERNKLNEMLRTSMTGGISRALTAELRSFLLREESGLSDTLGRVRKNLDACRRTRIEVAEARTLEHEISGIYAAGQGMFTAAIGSSRKRAAELSRKVADEKARVEQARRALGDLTRELEEASLRETARSERRMVAQAAHAESLERARRAQRALEIGIRLAELSRELTEADQVTGALRDERERAVALKRERKQLRDAARENYERAARGLADSEAGLDELHRNASEQRRARLLLDQARQLLADPGFEVAALNVTKERVTLEIQSLDAERAQSDRAHELARIRGEEAARARAALGEIEGEVAPELAYDSARKALSRLSELELSATRVNDLSQELQQAETLARRQSTAREQARALELGHLGSAIDVREQLLATEATLQALDDSVTEARREAESQRRRLQELEAKGAALLLASARFDEVLGRRKQLEAAAGAALANRKALTAFHSELLARREQLHRRLSDLGKEREELQSLASALQAGGGGIDPELLLLRDEVDGELLASRFEDLDLEEAARVEAELGPLTQAILVPDAERAARALGGRTRRLSQVLLVDEGAELLTRREACSTINTDVVVRERFGVRLSQLPERPMLGLRARRRRAEELEQRGKGIDAELETLEQKLLQTQGLLRECEELAAVDALLDAEDPKLLLEDCQRDREQATESAAAQSAKAELDAERGSALRLRRDKLTLLLSDAFLLEPPDQAARVEHLRAELSNALSARDELERVGAARQTLAEVVDALRGLGADGTLASSSQAELERKAERRNQLFQAAQILSELERVHHTLAFEDAERVLSERAALVPALQAQSQAARTAAERADELLGEAEAAWEEAVARFSEADAARAAVQAHHQRVREELAELGEELVPEQATRAALETTERLARELAALEREEREVSAERAVRAERRVQMSERFEQASLALLHAEESAAPAEESLAALLAAADAAKVSLSGFGAEAAAPDRDSAALAADASGKLDLLWGRLSTARGGAELIQSIQAELAEPSTAGDSVYLRVWLGVREWLRRRVPAQVADVADPLVSLERLRDQLSVLEHRLERQEHDLRGASEDVARGIDVSLRRAKAQVRRLNQSLEGIAFGSIQGVRVQIRRVERMDQVLLALRDGAAQELLFQSNLPIEEALNEIFKRFAGGKTGGQKLLDYREYIELFVEIRRQTGADWELANPSRLSTGEAIGVGATLMMVILTEWERDANLLRGKRGGGTLRFLFLDEANRLSQDNLGVLFDLCKNLDLQLLIAAPEVAKAEGNTTYRLVRRVADDGREEVIVSGRRALSAAEAERGAAADAPLPAINDESANPQLELLPS